MKYLIVFFFYCSHLGSCQVTTLNAEKKANSIRYDSLTNYLADKPHGYIGQELYVLPKNKSVQEKGYQGFILDPNIKYSNGKMEKSNIYKCCQAVENSIYEELSEKYFKVLDVVKGNPDLSYHGYFLKLKSKSSGDIVYYRYFPQDTRPSGYPFLVRGYFEKQKKLLVGKSFITRKRKWDYAQGEPLLDIVTGKEVEFVPGKVWTCIDYMVDPNWGQPALILKSLAGEKIALLDDHKNNETYVFSPARAEAIKKQFGETKWKSFLENKIELGMSKEELQLSVGKPDQVILTTQGTPEKEYWEYGTKMLTIQEGKVTNIRDL
ncbi:MAG TPA: hypothetical protein VF691_10945 [Cytophagaceae bacterium]|jgi:hypothetical protein